MPVFSLPQFVEAAARASVILASTGLVAAALRRSSASARHLVWALGLTSALLVPALALAVPKLEVPIVRLAAPAVSALPPEGGSYGEEHRGGRIESDLPPARVPGPVVSGFSRNSSVSAPASIWTRATSDLSPGAILFAIWALGAALVLGRMLLGLVAVQWMSRRTRLVTDGPWLALARGLAADLRLVRVRFVESATASMPMAWGIFRPSVLMPADANAWPMHRLRVVLLHELAHVKRRDCLTHLVAQIVCAAYWFNPLAWIAARRLRSERERACDDLVLAAGTRGSDYADELLDIARVMHAQRFPAVLAGASLAMAHRSQLEGRLIAILDPSMPRRGLTRARAAAAASVFAILIVSVASVQPWAQERAAAPAAETQTIRHDTVTSSSSTTTQTASSTHRATRQATDDVSNAVSGAVEGITSIVDGVVAGATQGAIKGASAGVQAGVAGGIADGVSRGVNVGVGVGVGVGTGVADAVIHGVAGDVDHAIEHAMPLAAWQGHPTPTPTPTPTPMPMPMPNPTPRSNGQRAQEGEGRQDGQKADPRAVNALMEALKDSDKEVRETAMHALVQLRDPRIFEPLTQALKDSSPDVRQQAVFGLGQLRDPRAVEPLMSVLHDSSADVRQQAVFALGQIRDPKAVDPLISALKDENADVREQAAFALGQIRNPKAVEPLVIALKDGNADVRQQAAFALGQLRDPKAVEGLTLALKDTNVEVRRQAAFALGQIRY